MRMSKYCLALPGLRDTVLPGCGSEPAADTVPATAATAAAAPATRTSRLDNFIVFLLKTFAARHALGEPIDRCRPAMCSGWAHFREATRWLSWNLCPMRWTMRNYDTTCGTRSTRKSRNARTEGSMPCRNGMTAVILASPASQSGRMRWSAPDRMSSLQT
jgi:hypothetical protein